MEFKQKVVLVNGSPATVLYVTDHSPGAIPNGTRVKKIVYERDDAHEPGMTGIIIGSLPGSLVPEVKIDFFYFVEWDDRPMIPVGVQDYKIMAVQ